MKSFLLISVLCIGTMSMKAQEFRTSHEYEVAIRPMVNDKEQTVFNAILSIENHPEFVVSNFKMMSPKNLEKITVQTLKNPKLLDVHEIIKMELIFNEPQGYTISKYILVKKDQTYVDLPAIVNMSENFLKSEALYVFPSQTLGQNNKILKLEIKYSDIVSTEHFEVLKSYAWHDDLNNSHKTTQR